MNRCIFFCIVLFYFHLNAYAFQKASPTKFLLFPPQHLKLQRFNNVKHTPVAKETRFNAATTNTIATVLDKDSSSFGKLTFRLSWISWWFQIVLTVISSVILTFANTVRQTSNAQSLWSSGFAFSSIGVVVSYFCAFLTWNNSRLAVRNANPLGFEQLRKCFQFSVTTCLIGMFATLLGAEQIVGTLASKVLSLQGIQTNLGKIFVNIFLNNSVLQKEKW